jgi:hypothetical protein
LPRVLSGLLGAVGVTLRLHQSAAAPESEGSGPDIDRTNCLQQDGTMQEPCFALISSQSCRLATVSTLCAVLAACGGTVGGTDGAAIVRTADAAINSTGGGSTSITQSGDTATPSLPSTTSGSTTSGSTTSGSNTSGSNTSGSTTSGSTTSGSTTSGSSSTSSSLKSVTLEWNANVEPDLAGYRVYYGSRSGSYMQPKGNGLDSGRVTSYTIAGLPVGATYYIAITAYDAAGNESGYSSEVATIVR